MAEDLFRQRQPGGHEEGRPVDAVEAEDVLADEVDARRPELVVPRLVIAAETERRDVVGQGVEPDIDHVVLVAGVGDAPLERGAGDGQILEPAFDKADDLVVPALGRMHSGLARYHSSRRSWNADSRKK